MGFGKWIALCEQRFNRGRDRRLKGALVAVVSIALAFVLTYLALHLLAPTPVLSLIVQSLLVFFCLAGHTLRREVRGVFEAVNRSVAEGRRQVGRIVGRDTTYLSPQEIRTAALETLAENMSDGIVAPLFYGLLLGVPGMMAYKMANTLDSMIAYRTERYRLFGVWAARIDDVLNYVPARLTALLLLMVGWAYSLVRPRASSPRRASLPSLFRFLLHYGPRHLSPNAGWPEAALAGLLDCRFGGTHSYFGEPCPKPYIGSNPRPLTDGDLRTSLSLCRLVELVAVVLVLLLL